VAANEKHALDWVLEQLAWECTLAKLRARAQRPSETKAIAREPIERRLQLGCVIGSCAGSPGGRRDQQ
jgi:hypothetical protein